MGDTAEDIAPGIDCATVPGLPGGNWIGPTVFEDVSFETSLGTEDVFGPVACLNRASSLDEAIQWMRASRYGNACSIFTTSGKAARRFRRARRHQPLVRALSGPSAQRGSTTRRPRNALFQKPRSRDRSGSA